MNIFSKLFAQSEEDLLELWRRIRAMDEDHLKDVARLKPKETSGQLAFVMLYMRSPDIVRVCKDEGNFDYMQSYLRNLYKNDAILLGDDSELKRLRKYIKEIIDIK